ncbi:MAG: HD domain-containing protein [Muribaculaceae bacterium]
MEIDVKANKEEFIRLLRSTNRDGVEDVIEELEEMGFFTAPASCAQHLNVEGGLVQHSLNVCRVALMLREQMNVFEGELKNEVPEDRVIIASLLHDVCKADIYFRTVKKRKTSIGTWEDSEGYKISYKNFPMGHGEKSVIVLMGMGLAMYDDEMLAIRWHMGAWDLAMQSSESCKNIDVARKLYPLCTLVQCADTLAAGIMERKDDLIDEL